VPRETEFRECSSLQLRPARRGIAAPSKLQRLQSWSTGITENILLEIHNTDLLFAAALRSSDQQHRHNHHNEISSKYTSGHQSGTGQSVQAENVNNNATDNMLLAFTMVPKIVTELSDAAREKENVAITTKAVFRLLTNNANNTS
jgi:hypothetical protein